MNSLSRYMYKARCLVALMTQEEKVSLLSGADFWHTKAVKRLGIPSLMVTDGPHGLRKQAGESDHLGINDSVPATAFPTASITACSFDRDLLQEMGVALGEECRANDVGVLLGPAVNIKRSPLCGRNFEYFSEDPFLTGEMATGIVNGIQSQNVGTCVKHFAANNQEFRRMVSDSIVDERALHEIYLSAFEAVVRNAAPWSLMCSYNKINGFFASDNRELLSDILRKKWGGVNTAVITDWGALNDRVKAVRAGLDLEMPSTGGSNDRLVLAAIRSGELSESMVDECVTRMVAIAIAYADNTVVPYDKAAHHDLARKIARESAVLLKNDKHALPLSKNAKIAVIGGFARNARYQGAGSSKINPTRINNVLDEFDRQKVHYVYAEGYAQDPTVIDEKLINQAVATAKTCDTIVVFAGLPDSYESEGYDRTHINMPESHNRLIARLTKLKKNVIVCLMSGSAVAMPWLDNVTSLLYMGLGGQNVGGACYDLLFGDYSPCGRLAETYPLKEEDCPAHDHFAVDSYHVEYRESIYVGYRYYDTAKVPVAFPFGYGLSYADFGYSDMRCDKSVLKNGESLKVSVKVTNKTRIKAKEVVQVYVSPLSSAVFCADHQLAGIAKVELNPNETKTVTITLSPRAFSYYNVKAHDWTMESGRYAVSVRSDSRTVLLSQDITVQAPAVAAPDYRNTAAVYYDIGSKPFKPYRTDFEKLLGKRVPPVRSARPFNLNTTMGQLSVSLIGKLMLSIALSAAKKTIASDSTNGEDVQRMVNAMVYDLPLRSMSMGTGGGITYTQVEGLATLLNHHPIKGLRLLLSKK